MGSTGRLRSLVPGRGPHRAVFLSCQPSYEDRAHGSLPFLTTASPSPAALSGFLVLRDDSPPRPRAFSFLLPPSQSFHLVAPCWFALSFLTSDFIFLIQLSDLCPGKPASQSHCLSPSLQPVSVLCCCSGYTGHLPQTMKLTFCPQLPQYNTRADSRLWVPVRTLATSYVSPVPSMGPSTSCP